MTMNLYWVPVLSNGRDLDDKLKFAMRKRFGGSVCARLDSSSLGYLEGLLDAGVDDAKKLIDAIEKHGEIKVYEE